MTLLIDGITVEAPAGATVIDAAAIAGIEIPTLCHDERVKAYGACGMCVVEEEGKPRLLRACSTAAIEGMRIITRSPRIDAVRRSALELMLSGHCGDCRPPCALACPAGTDCQGYVGLIANGDYEAAALLIAEKLPIPSSIGRVCPRPCEDECRRELKDEPINIGGLKYFATDKFLGKLAPKPGAATDKNVAVIGGGPGGLSAAYFLRRMGHGVTVFDQNPEMGGMLRYGIPEYRLPKSVLAAEVEAISGMGAEFRNNTKIGRDIAFADILKDYDAALIAVGAWKLSKIGCPGEDLTGVTGGIEFLHAAASGAADRLDGLDVAVVGGGNTAMDACRTAMRLGAASVSNIYRRTMKEMPARELEKEEAAEEGVIFLNLVNPAEITESGGRLTVTLQKMKLGEPDAGGRRAPVPIPGETETLVVDRVIAAIGQAVELSGIPELNGILTKRGTIAADERNYSTGIPGVFAVGDAVNKGPDIAVAAVGAGRKAAEAIDDYLNGAERIFTEPPYVKREMTAADYNDIEREPKAAMPVLDPQTRCRTFDEVALGYSEKAAVSEAKRCLECGCQDFFECGLFKYAAEYGADPLRFGASKRRRLDVSDHPFIERNPDKCVLCGLCVRMCDEALGIGALGFAGRGDETQAVPAMRAPLEKTDCVSCGLCVHACPTGALTERIPLRKSVPVSEVAYETVCPGCGALCEVVVTQVSGKDRAENREPRAEKETEAADKPIMRVLPRKGGILCGLGRFGLIERDWAWEYYYKNSMFVNISDIFEPSELDNINLTEKFLEAVKEADSAERDQQSRPQSQTPRKWRVNGYEMEGLSELRSVILSGEMIDINAGTLGVSLSPGLTNGEMAEAYALAKELGAEIFTLAGGGAADEADPGELLNRMIHAAPLKKHDKSELYFINEYPNRRGLVGLGVTRRENLKGIDALIAFGGTPELPQLDSICRTLAVMPNRGLFAHGDSYTRCDGKVIETGL